MSEEIPKVLASKSSWDKPQMKHFPWRVFSSYFLIALSSANVSIISPKIKFNIKKLTVIQNVRSKANLYQ